MRPLRRLQRRRSRPPPWWRSDGAALPPTVASAAAARRHTVASAGGALPPTLASAAAEFLSSSSSPFVVVVFVAVASSSSSSTGHLVVSIVRVPDHIHIKIYIIPSVFIKFAPFTPSILLKTCCAGPAHEGRHCVLVGKSKIHTAFTTFKFTL